MTIEAQEAKSHFEELQAKSRPLFIRLGMQSVVTGLDIFSQIIFQNVALNCQWTPYCVHLIARRVSLSHRTEKDIPIIKVLKDH